MSEVTKQLIKETKLKQKKKGKNLFYFSFPFVISLLVVVILSLTFTGSLFWTLVFAVPLVLIPLYLCLLISSFRLEVGQSTEGKGFYSSYGVGLSRPIRHGFFPLKSGLLAILVSFLYLFLVYGISMVIPSLSKAIQEIYSVTSSDIEITLILEEILRIYEDNPLLYLLIAGSELVGFLAFFVFFFHHGLYVICKLNAMLPNGKGKPVFQDVFPKYRKSYYQGYFALFWWQIPLILLLSIGGFALSYFIEKPEFCLFFALIALTLSGFLIVPNIVIYQETMYTLMFQDLGNQNKDYLKKLLQHMEIPEELSEEQKSELKKMLDDVEKTVEKWGDDPKQEDDDSSNEDQDEEK